MRTRLIRLLPTLCAAIPLSHAQSAAPSASPDATAAAVPAAATQSAAPASTAVTTEPAKPSVTRAKDTLSVDFPDEEIRTVLRNVADLFELNLVIPETLQGKTSVKLRDVTWRQIFKVVLEPVGYTFIEDGNIIKVVTVESLNLEPLGTDVFVLNYARAADVKPSLDALVDAKAGGKIVVDTRSNSLVVTERPSIIQKIRPIIVSLDKATEQVMIETKFIEVTDRDTKSTGINWSSLGGYGLTAGNLSRTYTTNHSSQNNQSYTNANDAVGFMNQGFENVDTIASRNLGGSNTDPNHGFGYDYTIDTNGNVSLPGGVGPSSNLAQSFFNTITGASNAVFSADDFKVVVSALKTFNDTKLVSNPTVVTLNNTEANINIGEEFPIPNYTFNQERGTFEVSGFIYKDIGVNLKVTPQVNSTGFIKLTVEPEVSSRNGTVNFGGAGGAEIPIIGVRKTKTQVTIKDGFTLGLGGLRSSTLIKDSSGIPVLSSIPFLKNIFGSNDHDNTTSNLVVFITARTLRPDGASVGEVFDPRMIREMQIGKDELPGYRDGSDPFYQAPAGPDKK